MGSRGENMSLMKESMILIAIGLIDLAITLHVVTWRYAVEGNPLMAYYLKMGIGAFVVVKLILLLLPVFIAEFSKHYKPMFVRWMLRGAIAVYLGSYLIAFLLVNVKPVTNQRDYVPNDEARQIRVAERTK